MSQKTNTNVAPYYDDYDKKKGFHRILFRPRTVQTRELTQMQTILQNQIESLSGHMFKEGSVVIPGAFNYAEYDVSASFVLTDGTDFADIENIDDLFIRVSNTGARIRVEELVAGDGVNNPHLMGSVFDANGNALSDVIRAGDKFNFIQIDEFGNDNVIGYADCTGNGTGTIATVEEGIYYTRGFFVEVEKQKHIIDRSEPVKNVRVGFYINEAIISHEQDSSLYSNAAGEPNALAPGADRLMIELQLSHRDIGDPDDDDFIELVRVENGVRKTFINNTQYSLIADTLAQRTFEESGDYSVESHQIEIAEHLNDGTNNGTFLEEDGGDEAKVAVKLKSGVSYVRGYRVANDQEVVLDVDKGRDTKVANNAVLASIYGGYLELKVAGSKGAPVLRTTASWRLVEGVTEIGYVNVISATKVGDVWRIYVRNARLDVGKKFTDVTSLRCEVGGANVFEAELSSSGLVGSSTQSLIFPLPVSGVRSIMAGGSADTTYDVMRDFIFTTDGSGNATVTAGVGGIFQLDTSEFYLSDETGQEGSIPFTATPSGTPLGSSMTISAPTVPNSSLRLLASVIKTEPQPRAKTLITTTENLKIGDVGVPAKSAMLGNTDIHKILRVRPVDNLDEDLTSIFRLENGQRESYYGLGSIHSAAEYEGLEIEVEYRYFRHSAGDYFSVDSYGDISYDEIPTFVDGQGNATRLCDSMDFRRSYANGLMDSGDTVKPNSTIRADIEYYVGRVDTVCVASTGDFVVKKGIPSNNPKRPELPSNAMRLYDLYIPPYTFDVTNIMYFEQDNRRYTMRDIGQLERRIDRVEETTSLNALEQSAMNTQVIDPITGLDRFKNGIFADPMVDNRILDIYDNETACAFRDNSGYLYPQDTANAIDLTTIYDAQWQERDQIIMPKYEEVESVVQPYATNWINVNPYASYNWSGTMSISPSKDIWWDTVYAPPRIFNRTIDETNGAIAGVVESAWKEADTIGSWWENGGRVQTRTVTTTTITSETTTANAGTNVINREVVPYMRDQEISFTAEGLRPNTRLYAWFNGVNVSSDVQPDGLFRGAPIVTDEYGRVSGLFFLTNREGKRFPSGKAQFELLDNKVTSRNAADRTTFTSAPYESAGVVTTAQQDLIVTRTLGATVRSEEEFRRFDPVAQSFAIDTDGGEWLNAVSVYFKTKSKFIPITLEIRGMENGLPTHDVLARKTLYPSNVNVSDWANVETLFRLKHPVYLEKDREYCFVLLANTQDYNVFYGKMGERIITQGEKRLTKQPNTGVMFVSANGSTWTPRQDSDMKFKLWRCNFDVGETVVEFRGKQQSIVEPLQSDAIRTVSGEGEVVIHKVNHGLRPGDTVNISGSNGGNGVSNNSINGSRTVTDVVSHNEFKVSVADVADSSGIIANSDATIRVRYAFNEMFAAINQTVLAGTDIKWEVRYRDVNRNLEGWIPFNPNETVRLVNEGSYGDTLDFVLRATMTSTSTNAPMIDLHGMTAVVSAFNVDEEVASFRYVTRDMMFSSPSDAINCYVGALLPQGSDMKLYIKYITTTANSEDQDWLELQPNTPITNDSRVPTEYQYSGSTDTAFVGVKVKIELTGRRSEPPLIKDLRGIVVA